MISYNSIMITVFADKYLFEIASFLPEEADLHLYDPEDGLPDPNNNMDALLIRTVTGINRHTWQHIPKNLQFIGTGSAGIDHVDTEFLKDHNITFEDAAGCNARSVAEYVITAMLLWAEEQDYELKNLQVAVIGSGHVGTEVKKLLSALEVSAICYDPPREERDKDFKSASLEEALSADILTFHTPLTEGGMYPTYHWLDDRKLAQNSYKLVINTSRGGVVDEQALYGAFINGKVKNFIIDVWENEPVFNDLIADKAFIKTPHIAGYSRRAKWKASKIVADALCEHFSLQCPENAQIELNQVNWKPDSLSNSMSLSQVLCLIHPIKDYERRLTTFIGLPPEAKRLKFNKLRAEHLLRNEFSEIYLPKAILDKLPVLEKMDINAC